MIAWQVALACTPECRWRNRSSPPLPKRANLDWTYAVGLQTSGVQRGLEGRIESLWRNRSPSIPHPSPFTLHPSPFTLHLSTFTLHPKLYTPHPTPFTLHPSPYTLHPSPFTLHPAPCTLHPSPSTLHSAPHTPLFINDDATTFDPRPFTLHSTPHTLHPTPSTCHSESRWRNRVSPTLPAELLTPQILTFLFPTRCDHRNTMHIASGNAL